MVSMHSFLQQQQLQLQRLAADADANRRKRKHEGGDGNGGGGGKPPAAAMSHLLQVLGLPPVKWSDVKVREGQSQPHHHPLSSRGSQQGGRGGRHRVFLFLFLCELPACPASATRPAPPIPHPTQPNPNPAHPPSPPSLPPTPHTPRRR